MTNARDQIIDRIRKLSKMTTENGCSEAEALQAARRVAELIAEHQVADTELSLRRDAHGCVVDEFIELTAIKGEWDRVIPAIAKLYNTKVWYERRHEDILGLGIPTKLTVYKFFGFPEDVAASLALVSICYTAVASEAEAYVKAQRKRKLAKSFQYGMALRLAERIREMLPQATTSNSRALIPLKNQLVLNEFAEYCRRNDLRLSSATRRHSTLDPTAAAAGRAAGSRVDLGGKKVGTSPKALPSR